MCFLVKHGCLTEADFGLFLTCYRNADMNLYVQYVVCRYVKVCVCTCLCISTERSTTASPIMTELAPSPAPSSSSSSSSQANASISSKAWRSKSLSAKHSSTSTLLSVKQDLPPCQAPPPQASPRQAPLEVPSKVIAQKSMLEKLKLFNSKSGSKGGGGSVGARPETPPGLDPERGQRGQSCPGLELHLEVEGNSRPPSAIARPTTPTSTSSTASSPKLALKGIAQRTFSRALTPRRSSLKPGEKDKARPKERGDLPSSYGPKVHYDML